MRLLAFLLALALSPGTSLAQAFPDMRRAEERTRYELSQADGTKWEVLVIRWHLDHEMNSTALLRYASLEVAEQRGIRLFGDYQIDPRSGEGGFYSATISAEDGDTSRFATAEVSGSGREVVTVRAVSWGASASDHSTLVPELIEEVKKRAGANKAVDPTPGSAHRDSGGSSEG